MVMNMVLGSDVRLTVVINCGKIPNHCVMGFHQLDDVLTSTRCEGFGIVGVIAFAFFWCRNKSTRTCCYHAYAPTVKVAATCAPPPTTVTTMEYDLIDFPSFAMKS